MLRSCARFVKKNAGRGVELNTAGTVRRVHQETRRFLIGAARLTTWKQTIGRLPRTGTRGIISDFSPKHLAGQFAESYCVIATLRPREAKVRAFATLKDAPLGSREGRRALTAVRRPSARHSTPRMRRLGGGFGGYAENCFARAAATTWLISPAVSSCFSPAESVKRATR
jgi:hypothetical protein